MSSKGRKFGLLPVEGHLLQFQGLAVIAMAATIRLSELVSLPSSRNAYDDTRRYDPLIGIDCMVAEETESSESQSLGNIGVVHGAHR